MRIGWGFDTYIYASLSPKKKTKLSNTDVLCSYFMREPELAYFDSYLYLLCRKWDPQLIGIYEHFEYKCRNMVLCSACSFFFFVPFYFGLPLFFFDSTIVEISSMSLFRFRVPWKMLLTKHTLCLLCSLLLHLNESTDGKSRHALKSTICEVKSKVKWGEKKQKSEQKLWNERNRE